MVGWALIRGWALINFFCLQDGRLFEVGANSRLGTYSNKYGILLHEKFLQFDWLRAEIPTCENYKPFAGSSINK